MLPGLCSAVRVRSLFCGNAWRVCARRNMALRRLQFSSSVNQSDERVRVPIDFDKHQSINLCSGDKERIEFWKDTRNGRQFLMDFAVRNDLTHYEDWYDVKRIHIVEQGGLKLLQAHGNMYQVLSAHFPEYKWVLFRFRRLVLPTEYWNDIDNQRAFIEYIIDRHNIQKEEDWNEIFTQDLIKSNGRGFIRLYPSMRDALRTIYPDKPWDMVSQLPFNKIGANTKYRTILEDIIASKVSCQTIDLTREDIEHTILTEDCFSSAADYNEIIRCYGSIDGAVKKLLLRKYPKHNRLPVRYWDNVNNQRNFLDFLAKKLEIKQPSDWSRVVVRDFIKYGGSAIFKNYDSLEEFYRFHFPDDWKQIIALKRYPPNYWSDPKNQRTFLDNFASQNNIRKESDWESVLVGDIKAAGGRQLLAQYPSLADALQALYPENHWEDFCSKRQTKKMWDDPVKVRSFLERKCKHFGITELQDWYRISWWQITQAGGASLLRRYGDLCSVLRVAYPDYPWDWRLLISQSKKSSQRVLCRRVQELFPNTEVIEEYYHEEISRVSGAAVEIDVYVPSLKLGFEYNGRHHYEDVPMRSSLELQQKRDEEKKQICDKLGIHLLSVPFWWNHELSSLVSLMNEIPDISIPEKLHKE